MIFRQSIKREFTQSAIGVFFTLLSITITVYLVQLLNRAAGGRIEAQTVGPTLAFMVINFVPTLLAITLFIAILSTLSRMVRDSEMIIWQSAGMPLKGFVVPVLQFSLPMVFLIGALTLFLSPLAAQQNIRYQDMLKRRSDVSRVSPGIFRESQSAERVFFVESFDEESQTIRNIFIHTPAGEEGVRVVSANRADVHTMEETGQRFIALQEGRSFYGSIGKADFAVMNFERYMVAVGLGDSIQRDLPTRAQMTTDLVDDPTPKHLDELLWRVNIPLVALGLCLMAIPLSIYNPRTNQSANFIFALLTFLVYTNLLNLGRTFVAQEKLSFWEATLAVHASALLILLFFSWLGRLYRSFFR